MAKAFPNMTVVGVNASNVVLGASGVAGTAVRQRQMVVRAVASNGKIIESSGTAGSVNGNPSAAAIRVVDASNNIINSSGTSSGQTAQPSMVVMFVGSNGVGFGSSGSGLPTMDVRVLDETGTILDALYGAT
jgi:hypothetical protein